MRIIYQCLLFLLLFHGASAQLNTDSLKKELSTAKEDSNKVNILLQLSKHYTWRSPDSCILYGMEGLSLAEHLSNEKVLGLFYQSVGEALAGKGNFPLALEIKLKSLELAEKTGNDFGIAWSNAGVGAIYFYLKDYQTALTYFTKTKKFPAAHKANEKRFSGFIGETYFHLGQLDSAFLYINRAYELDRLAPDWSVPYYYLAKIFVKRKEFSKAISFYKRGISLPPPALDVIEGNIGLATVFNEMGTYDSAIYYGGKGLAIAQDLSFESKVMEASSVLKDAYKAIHNNDSAFWYQELMLAAQDSVYSQEKLSQIQNLSFTEQFRQQEILRQQQQYRTRVKIYALVALGFVFLVIALLLWRNNRYKQRAVNLLQKQKQETEEQRVKAENALVVLKRTQAQLIQSEKMASLGELTAGIAHEIQNPLNFVNNFSDVSVEMMHEIKQAIEKGDREDAQSIADDVIENLDKVLHHGKRADAIVKGMLQHSRVSSGNREPTDMNALAEEYLKLSFHGIRAKDSSFKASFTIDPDESIDKINLVPQDIGRVLLNLYNNAFYSVNEKKKLLNGTFEPAVLVRTKRAGNNVEIYIWDNGMGIPIKVVDKIYQPFFTTKPTGEGTGLGLSLSYDIIRAHGGEIKVESKENEYAAFIIQLPA